MPGWERMIIHSHYEWVLEQWEWLFTLIMHECWSSETLLSIAGCKVSRKSMRMQYASWEHNLLCWLSVTFIIRQLTFVRVSHWPPSPRLKSPLSPQTDNSSATPWSANTYELQPPPQSLKTKYKLWTEALGTEKLFSLLIKFICEQRTSGYCTVYGRTV